MKLRLARKGARLAEERKVVKRNSGSRSSSSFSFKECAVGKSLRRGIRGTRGSDSPYEQGEGNRSTKAGSREPQAGLRLASKVRISSEPESRGEIRALETYSTENAPIAVIEITSSTTRQEDISTKWEK